MFIYDSKCYSPSLCIGCCNRRKCCCHRAPKCFCELMGRVQSLRGVDVCLFQERVGSSFVRCRIELILFWGGIAGAGVFVLLLSFRTFASFISVFRSLSLVLEPLDVCGVSFPGFNLSFWIRLNVHSVEVFLMSPSPMHAWLDGRTDGWIDGRMLRRMLPWMHQSLHFMSYRSIMLQTGVGCLLVARRRPYLICLVCTLFGSLRFDSLPFRSNLLKRRWILSEPASRHLEYEMFKRQS